MLNFLILPIVFTLAQHPKITIDGPASTITFLDNKEYTIYNENNLTISDSNNDVLFTISQQDVCNITLNRRMIVNGDLLGSISSPVKIQSFEQWKLAVIEDFQGQITGWSDSSISNCGSSPDLFLGGHCKFAGKSVSKTFDLPDHSYVRVRFSVNFLDKWEGESVHVKLDSNIVWSESYQACNNLHSTMCQYKGIDVCGDDYPDRIGHPVEWSGVHTAESVNLEFSSTLDRDSCEVSWGIDHLEIYIR